MEELLSTLGVTGLFLLRIGVPVLVLISLGIMIDRWQSKRHAAEQEVEQQPVQKVE